MKKHVVVNVRGTSGSGKSHVAYRLIEQHMNDNVVVRQVMGGKERHAGHQLDEVFFVGKYLTDCGGCDSMSWKGAADDICDLIRHKAAFGPVFFEGLMCSSWGSGRLADLARADSVDLHVLMLTTPLDVCLASVQARRDAAYKRKGQVAPPLNPKKTTSKWHDALNGARILEKMGVQVEYLDREGAFKRALELLTS